MVDEKLRSLHAAKLTAAFRFIFPAGCRNRQAGGINPPTGKPSFFFGQALVFSSLGICGRLEGAKRWKFRVGEAMFVFRLYTENWFCYPKNLNPVPRKPQFTNTANIS